MDNGTRTLLNLTDPHLNFPHHWLKYKVIKNVRVVQISCTLSYTPRACPNCGVINRGQILKYGFYQAKYKYGQFRAQPLVLLVKTQRFHVLTVIQHLMRLVISLKSNGQLVAI